MNVQEALTRLLDDLGKVMRVCREDQLGDVPDSTLYYLADNHDAIVFYVDQIYSKTDRRAREEKCKEHRELHYSAVSDGFRQLAVRVVDNAKDNREEKKFLEYPLHQVSQDDLDVLLRVLKYAKHLALDVRNVELLHSPIEDHGLTRRVGNFLSITDEEWRAVPWYLSDILFAERKNVVESEALARGLDLVNRTVSKGSDIDSVGLWTDLLAQLLEFKVECDWAAVMQVAKLGREKYVNAVVGRAECGSTGLIGQFRESLENWACGRNAVDPFHAAVRDSDPLIQRYQDLLKRLPSVQPRPAIYESMVKLQSRTQTVIQEVRGDFVMREKYENVIHGQGVIAPHGHVHDVNFSQLWNQNSQQIQLPKLAEELKSLREALRARAQVPEQDAATGYIAKAEIEARDGEGPRALEYLSKAGKWALEVAKDVGVNIAAKALGAALGLSTS